MTPTSNLQPKRRAAKVIRRRQLIEAAIKSIAKRGLGDTTMAHVAQAAGLSQGIVNLHFDSKDNLLNETLNYIRHEYEENWRNAIDKAPDDSAQQLAALLRSDYNKKVADIQKLAVWFAFWGEAKSRPTYKKTGLMVVWPFPTSIFTTGQLICITLHFGLTSTSISLCRGPDKIFSKITLWHHSSS